MLASISLFPCTRLIAIFNVFLCLQLHDDSKNMQNGYEQPWLVLLLFFRKSLDQAINANGPIHNQPKPDPFGIVPYIGIHLFFGESSERVVLVSGVLSIKCFCA